MIQNLDINNWQQDSLIQINQMFIDQQEQNNLNQDDTTKNHQQFLQKNQFPILKKSKSCQNNQILNYNFENQENINPNQFDKINNQKISSLSMERFDKLSNKLLKNQNILDSPKFCQNNLCFKNRNMEQTKLFKAVTKASKVKYYCLLCFDQYKEGCYCELCDQIYFNDDSMQHPDLKEQVECELCNKWVHLECEQQQGLQMTFDQINNQECKFFCHQCRKSRSKRMDLKNPFRKYSEAVSYMREEDDMKIQWEKPNFNFQNFFNKLKEKNVQLADKKKFYEAPYLQTLINQLKLDYIVQVSQSDIDNDLLLLKGIFSSKSNEQSEQIDNYKQYYRMESIDSDRDTFTHGLRKKVKKNSSYL